MYDFLNDRRLLDYGCTFSGELVREFLEIEMPEVGTFEQFQRVQLLELAAIDKVRAKLLETGRYLSSNRGWYRVLLPHENQHQVELYMKSADNKLNRALKLNRNSPEHFKARDSLNIEARIVGKMSSRRYSPGQHCVS